MKSLKIYTLFLVAFLFATAASLNAQTARVQIIHNSADAAASEVDVWLNNTKLLDNFAFRTATPFIDAPAGVLLNIGIAPANSTSWTQSFKIKQVSLTENQTYIIIAEGIRSTSGYNPSPAFDVEVRPIGRESASQSGNTDVLVSHGATDAPTVDIYETGVGAGQIVNNLMYGNVAGYLELPTSNYVLEVRDETGTVTVASYSAPLATLGLQGQAITVLASGFLNPSANSNGAPFGLYVAHATGGALVELPVYNPTPTARVQVIHNAADAAAASVDVWLNDTKLLADFAFRTATPFIDAPAGVEFTIAIQPPGSASPANPIWSQNYTLAAGGSYILVANGLVDSQNYTPFKPFDIYVLPTAMESATAGNETAISVFHGSTDAPTVDIVEVGVGAGTIVDDLVYGNFVDYLNVITADYVIEVRDATGTVTVASYAVPLATLGLQGQALTVLASGFLNPSANNNGAPFGLYVALSSGGALVELPVYSPTARVQVIHNAADAAAASVDVWLNDTKLLADFAFRTATPFIDAPAGVEFTIAIQPPGSTSPANPIWSQNYTLAAGGSYILVANGLVDNQNYTPFKPFDIYVLPTALETAANSNETAVAVFHGSTDAPTVDVVETGVGAGTIINNFEYGNFAGYLNLPTADYVLEVRDETGTVTVASYSAPLATLGLQGQALTVLASGFLNPSANNNGAPFGLYAALATGGALVELPVYSPTARVQVIHNAADAAAASVDVWLNDTKLLADFAFRTATPFIDAPAGVEFTIAIQPPGSTSPANPIWSQNYTLADGETYVLVANGLVDNQNYTPFKPFDIYVYPMGREASASSNLTDVLVFHGSTDAPAVDVVEIGVGAGTIIDNFEYGNFAGYLSLTTTDYVLAIRDESGTTTVAAFAAPLETLGLGGQALTVVASGFLNPLVNNNGEPFGLYAALASGGALVQLPVVTSVEEQNQIGAFNLYPNPATSRVNISLDILSDSEVSVSIYNIIGSLVKNENLGRLTNGIQNKSIDVTDLSEGVYLMKVTANNSQITQKVLINK
jgi:exosome complex RNA-binding protein Rrp42 (RNase PH superfamily)